MLIKVINVYLTYFLFLYLLFLIKIKVELYIRALYLKDFYIYDSVFYFMNYTKKTVHPKF